jgi:hypothetical protein
MKISTKQHKERCKILAKKYNMSTKEVDEITSQFILVVKSIMEMGFLKINGGFINFYIKGFGKFIATPTSYKKILYKDENYRNWIFNLRKLLGS